MSSWIFADEKIKAALNLQIAVLLWIENFPFGKTNITFV